jgi:hypothetical protein
MNTYNAEDHTKYNYALLGREIRRLTAKVHHANIDNGTTAMIDSALEQLEGRVSLMSFHDPASGRLIQDQDTYSHGGRVTTTINWCDGSATLVHPRDALDDSESGSGPEELTEELWPEGPPPAEQRHALRLSDYPSAVGMQDI